MISRIMGELSARRNSLKEKEKGFTLIELLVVIVIIGILAAIAIPVYLGVQNSAKDTAAKADLSNAKTAVVAYQTDNNATMPTLAMLIPAPSPTGLGTYGFTQSTNTKSIIYGTVTATTFCMIATSITNNKFYVTESLGVSTTVCT
jgi:type IV pilus assembly protein PilA